MRRMSVAATLVALSVLLAACGSSDSEESTSAATATAAATTSTTSTASTAADGGGDSAWLTENAAIVEKYLSETGTFEPPPETAPKPKAGKHVVLVRADRR